MMSEAPWKPMPYERYMWESAISLMAYDKGATDSGIHDEVLRAKVKDWLRALPEDEFRLTISRFVRRDFLSEKALALRYGIEDVAAFLRWLADYMDYDIR